MNLEDIIRMARNEYGIYAFTAESLAEFATIIAAAECEACAKVCEGLFQQTPPYTTYAEAAQDCAAAIRARGEQ